LGAGGGKRPGEIIILRLAVTSKVQESAIHNGRLYMQLRTHNEHDACRTHASLHPVHCAAQRERAAVTGAATLHITVRYEMCNDQRMTSITICA